MIDNLFQQVLGETDQPFAVDTSADCREAAVALARQARRSLHILSHDLDPALYDNAAFAHAVKMLAIRSRGARVEVLVRAPEGIVKRGHRLIELSRRLTSFIELRKLNEDYAHYADGFLIADRRGVLHRLQGDRYEGTVSFNAPLRAQELLELFATMWGKSQPFVEFRRLYL